MSLYDDEPPDTPVLDLETIGKALIGLAMFGLGLWVWARRGA